MRFERVDAKPPKWVVVAAKQQDTNSLLPLVSHCGQSDGSKQRGKQFVGASIPSLWLRMIVAGIQKKPLLGSLERGAESEKRH